MLKLLKYDMKRDQFMLLGGTLALILALLAIEFGGRRAGIANDARSVLSFMVYAFMGLLILIAVCNSFRSNIRSFGRRLVPIGSVHHVLSALLYAIVLVLSLMAIAGLHLWYYQASGILQALRHSGGLTVSGPASVPLAIPFSMLWSSLFLTTLLLGVTAFTESLNVKGKSLIALILIVVVLSVVAGVENSLLGGQNSPVFQAFYIEDQSNLSFGNENIGINARSFGFELFIAAFFIWITTKLIDRKVAIG